MFQSTDKILILIFLLNYSYSQEKFSISAYGGYSLPLSDLKGDFPSLSSNEKINFFTYPDLLTSSGYNIGASFKYTYDSSAKGRLTGGLQISQFTGSGEYPNLKYKNTINIFTVYGGAEFFLTQSNKTKPFIGGEITANFFSGKVEATGDTNFTANRKSESRFGLGINAGVEFVVSKTNSFSIGLKYHLANLLGRKTENITYTSAGNSDVPEDPVNFLLREIPLNDAETSSNRSKSIHHLQLYVSISYSFGGRSK